MTKGKRKEPKAAEDPRPAGRIPRQGDDPEKSLGEKIAWGLGRSDFSGPWGVEGLSKTKWWGGIVPETP